MRRVVVLVFLVSLLALLHPAGAQTTPTGTAPTVFAWDGMPSHPALTPMSWVYNASDTIPRAVSRIQSNFAKTPPGKRAVFFFGLGSKPRMTDASRPFDSVLNGHNTTAEAAYVLAIFKKMRDLKLVPDRVVLDWEDNLSMFRLTVGRPNVPRSVILSPIWADQRTYAKLPPSVKAFTPADYDNANSTNAYAAWNQWAHQLDADALRKIVVDSSQAAFGKKVPTTNYMDFLSDYPAYDLNGWAYCVGAVNGESSPALYLIGMGNRYNRGLTKDPRWNRFIDNVNAASAAAAKAPLVPWISFPSYDGDEKPVNPLNRWLFAEQAKHLNELGVTTYLLFNPHDASVKGANWTDEDRFAGNVLSALRTKTYNPKTTPFKRIPLDADEVTTGGVTTRYADFLASRRAGAPVSASAPTNLRPK